MILPFAYFNGKIEICIDTICKDMIQFAVFRSLLRKGNSEEFAPCP